jgi:mannose-6-phosphate isomerase-like protein (cupin superfamily)
MKGTRRLCQDAVVPFERMSRWKNMQSDMDFANIQMEYLNHRHCTPQWCILPVRTHFIDLSYVVAGRATYYVNGAAHEVRAGDLICIPQGSFREA